MIHSYFSSPVAAALFVLVSLAVAGCGDAGRGSSGSSAGLRASDGDPQALGSSKIQHEVLSLTNMYRARSGLAPLALDYRLNRAAQAFAEEMAERDWMSHYGRDGSTPAGRIRDAGYEWSTFGENVAAGYADAQGAMWGWMGSRGHRRNILTWGFEELGVGVAVSGTGTAYWVQDFGTL